MCPTNISIAVTPLHLNDRRQPTLGRGSGTLNMYKTSKQLPLPAEQPEKFDQPVQRGKRNQPELLYQPDQFTQSSNELRLYYSQSTIKECKLYGRNTLLNRLPYVQYVSIRQDTLQIRNIRYTHVINTSKISYSIVVNKFAVRYNLSRRMTNILVTYLQRVLTSV